MRGSGEVEVQKNVFCKSLVSFVVGVDGKEEARGLADREWREEEGDVKL